MANFVVSDPGEFIAIDPKTGEERFRAKTNIADANVEWGDKIVTEMNDPIEDLEYIGNESEFLEGDPVWFARYYYPKRTIGIISQSYSKNIVSEGEIFLFDQFGSTAIWNFAAKKSEYSQDQFLYEVFKAVGPRVKRLLEEDEKKRTKYPISELYYLRYDLWDSDEAGERRHPCEVVKALGGKELRFEGCPMGDCDYILARFDEPPVLPKYIDDYSTDKEEKDRIKKEFPEFILED